MAAWFILSGWFLSIITVVGNGFVVFIIAQNHRLHSSANWLVLFLAVADLGVGVVSFPIGYLCTMAACNLSVYMAFHWFFLHSSVANLCVLTWDRYTAIVHPLKYITCMTARRPGRVILLAWFIPLAISLYLIIGMYVTDSHTVWKVLRLTGVSAFDILACILLLYGVARILFVAWAKAKDDLKNTVQSPEPQSSRESVISRRRKKHNTVVFLIAIVTFFLGCHVVINYLLLCITFSCNVTDVAPRILTLFLVVNSAANPIVYAFLKPDIKTELKKLFCRKHKRRDCDYSEASMQRG